MSSRNAAVIPGVSTPAVHARFGLKGPDAPALLEHLGLRIPALPNRVTHWHVGEEFGSGRCLRQGSSEFLIELDSNAPPVPLASALQPRAWTLIRADHSLLLDGSAWPQKLAQLCSFDFERLRSEPDLVVMTLMAGISVTLIREPQVAAPRAADMPLRLWCDAGFSTYLQDCLHSISLDATPAPGEFR